MKAYSMSIKTAPLTGGKIDKKQKLFCHFDVGPQTFMHLTNNPLEIKRIFSKGANCFVF